MEAQEKRQRAQAFLVELFQTERPEVLVGCELLRAVVDLLLEQGELAAPCLVDRKRSI